MSEQIRPPLPDITDGEAGVNHLMVDAFLEPATGLRLSIQVEDDGSYRTSVLRIGAGVRGVTVFAKRDQVERLHRQLGRHLEQLDAYDRLLNGPAAAPDPDATIAEAFAARKPQPVRPIHFALLHPADAGNVCGVRGPAVTTPQHVECPACREWIEQNLVASAGQEADRLNAEDRRRESEASESVEEIRRREGAASKLDGETDDLEDA